MITRSNVFLYALIFLMLLVSSGSAYSKNVDCRSCHVRDSSSGAGDLGAVYANSANHHSVDINYPVGLRADRNFHLPSGQSGDIAFFDTNGNGQPDIDEIQLFGTDGAITITCSSCHGEHGSTEPTVGVPKNAYLRITTEGSKLCSTCHNQ